MLIVIVFAIGFNMNGYNPSAIFTEVIFLHSTGVAWGCRWSWDTVGVFKEICYCETNNCNGASGVKVSFASIAVIFVGYILRKFL